MPRLETKGTKSYQEALLQRGHNLGLELERGWIFCIVRALEDSRKELIDVDGMAAAAGTHGLRIGGTNAVTAKQFLEWTNVDNNSVFFHKDPDIVLQRFIGISPPRLRWWEKFPQDQLRGKFHGDITVGGSFDDESVGYVDGLSRSGSPLMEPTTLTEAFIPKDVHIEEGLYNPELYLVNPKFFIAVRRLQVHWLDSTVPKDRVLIEGIMSGKERKVLWSPGIAPWEYDAKAKLGIVPTEWVE